jgi:hypothetical protein
MNKTKIYPSKEMNPLCEMAGCSDEEASEHAQKWQRKRWHSHPDQSFLAWWNPHSFDPVSGASVGGHPDAARTWARKDPGKWVRRRYGTSAIVAWNTAPYLEEFQSWKQSGSPETEDFVSIAATLERQKQFWHDLKPIILQIGKPMP